MSRTTTGRPRIVSDRQLYGYTVAEWRDAARGAQVALQSDPNDAEARQQLQDAQAVLRESVSGRGLTGLTLEGERPIGMIMSQRNEAGVPVVGRAAAFGQGASQGMTANLGDEAGAALVTMLASGGQPFNVSRYAAERDAMREFDRTAQRDQPGYHLAGNIGGALLLSGAGAGAAGSTNLAPWLTGAARLGGGLPSTMARTAAAGAGLGALEGALFTYGAGEEGPISDLAGAPGGAAVGAFTGAVAAPLGAIGVRRARHAAESERLLHARRELYERMSSRAAPSAAPRPSASAHPVLGNLSPDEQAMVNTLRTMRDATEEDIVRAVQNSRARYGTVARRPASDTRPVQTPSASAPPTPTPSSSVAEAASGPLPSTAARRQRGATRGQLEHRAQQLEGVRGNGGTSAPRSFVDIIRQLPPERIPEAVGQLSSAQLRVLWQHVQLARATGSLSPELDNVLTQAARSRMATLRAGAP